jgi:hypothetical protein
MVVRLCLSGRKGGAYGVQGKIASGIEECGHFDILNWISEISEVFSNSLSGEWAL